MPQEFQVLCCYKCDMFQVHHMKKAKKWLCKICNEKQSFKKAYKISSAPDCRSLCQKLNMQRGGVKFDYKADSAEEVDDAFINDEYSSAMIDAAGINRFGDQLLSESEHGDEIFSKESRNVCPSSDVCTLSSTTIESSNKIMECFQEEIVQPVETTEYNWDIDFKESNIFSKGTDSQPVNFKSCKESHKHPLDIEEDISSQSVIMPPVKKNRGFEMIKNMKYFQREIALPTETSKFNQNIGFKKSSTSTEEKIYEVIDSKNSKESYQYPFEIKADVQSQSLVIHPVKKNHGFLMIKNAASKLI